jgi:hypothetical protein
MRTPRRFATRRPLAFWAIAGLALLLSHNAVYLVQVGPGAPFVAALRDAGHGYWGAASAALAVVGFVAIAIALVRLWILRRRALDIGARAIRAEGGFGGRWLAAWVRLLAVVAVGFLVQENVEHFIGHNHAPGLGALVGPEYPLALPILAVISAAGALALAALHQAEHILLESIAVALRRATTRPPRAILRPPLRIAVPAAAPMAGASAGRAPPPPLVSAA